MNSEEFKRIEMAREGLAPWRKWGPYLSERQWGTVREDYSSDGSAWNYFPHDHARSKVYRWGEDGIAGFSDDKQYLCFSLALWNGQDPILKERLFGLTGSEGNHGEDVKEYYFYVDNTPTHSYAKYLYKYPQKRYPYEELVEENQKRSRNEPEYELLDTGIFNDDAYFDVFIEYAKEAAEEVLIRISIFNRGHNQAKLTVLPTLWFRNFWSFEKKKEKPSLQQEARGLISSKHPVLGQYWLHFDENCEAIFTENETNPKHLDDHENASSYAKDAFHEYIVSGAKKSINPNQQGTKSAVVYRLDVGPQKSATIKLRLSQNKNLSGSFGENFDKVFENRIEEADNFYREITPQEMPEDMRSVQRQAFAGLLWNKQLYHYNVDKWLKGDCVNPTTEKRKKEGRNHEWKMLNAFDVFSMPDKWEYPWFAAWDLSFHTVALALIDPDFAKKQIILLNQEWYMHPNGQIPAYEWSFSDVNPPVQAWAAMRIYQIEKTMYGRSDRKFLEKVFLKLSLNFSWWVNREDSENLNVFEGGFLGLDNIGAFDRDKEIPEGGHLKQVDGTGWMGMYCLNLLQISLELAKEDEAYEDMATKFFEHFIYIADAMNNIGEQAGGLWNAEKEFYYGLLTLSDGKSIPIDVDTLIGVIPLFAVAPSNPKIKETFPKYRERFQWFIENKPELLEEVMQLNLLKEDKQFMLAMVSPEKLRGILKKILSEDAFLSSYGVRSVSRSLMKNPYKLNLDGKEFILDYEPAESTSSLFGGNSNWRGPIWFPLNFLLIESLQRYHYYLGDEFKVEFPEGSGKERTLWEVSMELTNRLVKTFLKDKNGKRPVYGKIEKFQTDPHWKDYILFHEYFHGDNGTGLGASNQTGWTGLVAKLIQQYAEYALQDRSPKTIGDRMGPV